MTEQALQTEQGPTLAINTCYVHVSYDALSACALLQHLLVASHSLEHRATVVTMLV
jgi:hypothetical protein